MPASLLALLLLLPACGRLGVSLPVDPQQAERMASLRYPQDAVLSDDLDIVVRRQGAAIQLVNRTALGFTQPRVWLNREYVADLDRVRIGTDNWVDLVKFVNRHGESFPVGGLLTPDKARPVVSADLIDAATGELHRLTVRPQQ